jgi:hypothetical protein
MVWTACGEILRIGLRTTTSHRHLSGIALSDLGTVIGDKGSSNRAVTRTRRLELPKSVAMREVVHRKETHP